MTVKAWIWALGQLRALAGDRRGTNLVEFALLIAIAILIVLIAVRNFGESFLEATNFISDEIGNAVGNT